MFSGGLLSWMVLIPLMVYFGGDSVGTLFANEGAAGVWDQYIRYIGAGALVAGGFISLVKSIPLIVKTFAEAIKGLKGGVAASNDRTSKDMNFLLVIGGVV